MKFFFLLFLTYNLFASDFRVSENILDSIKNNECLKEKGICNPLVIRLNKQEDILNANSNGFNIEKNLIKCDSKEHCSFLASSLKDIGILNMDLGPYQINYFYHPYSFETYFDEMNVREKVNEILVDLINRYGYSWETLGRYHKSVEFDSNANKKYYLKLQEYLSKN